MLNKTNDFIISYDFVSLFDLLNKTNDFVTISLDYFYNDFAISLDYFKRFRCYRYN